MLKEARASLYKQNSETKLNILLNTLIVLVIIVLAAEMLFTVNYSGVYVVHDSMRPTLIGAESDDQIGGDYIYINKHAKPNYGDIVVVNHRTEGCLIKRVIAFGGDRVKLVGGELYIWRKGTDGFKQEPEPEPYILPEYNDSENKYNTFANDEEGYQVEEGCFFLLGDNRNISKDSRDPAIGSVPLTSLDGVVTEWSLKHKSLCTSFHNFFKFKLPSLFRSKKQS